MGGGKGSQQGTKHVNGTIACLIGLGPLYALDAIILNGETVWSGPLLRGTSTGPAALSTKYGTIRFYWGTEEQPADSTLNTYEEHPPYAGLAYVVFVDYDHGQSTNAYNCEFVVRSGPAQELITGASAAASLDSGLTCNPIVAAAEILTSPSWLGLPASAIDTASAQAVADLVQGDAPSGSADGRSASAASPLYADATDCRAALAALAGMADAWLRLNAAGQIEFGRWLRGVVPVGLTTLTHDDFSAVPQVDFDNQEEQPNSYAVEFTDSDAVHKEAKLTVDDQAGIVETGRLIRKTIKADWLITADQAIRAGQEALRRGATGGSWSGSVRWGKAVTPAGAPLQPGDYVRVPLSQPGASATVNEVIRITKVVYPADDTAPVEISGTIDPPAAPAFGTAQASAASDSPGTVVPPIALARVLALPALATSSPPPLHLLAARPLGLSAGVSVYYDDSLAGDFPLVGRQPSYALPVSLVASLSAGASTVRVALLSGVDGVDLQRDSSYLRNWVGGLTEGRNDELLLILLHKEEDGTITGTATTQSVEVLSISGAPALVSGATFDLPVLRGRRGTAALAFTAGSFPAAWASYEGWVIPRYSLEILSHADFDSMLTSGATGYFRAGGYCGSTLYAPAAAYAERERRAAAELDLAEFAGQPDAGTWSPALTCRIPSGLYTALTAAGVAVDNSTNGLTSSTTQGAVDELAARASLPDGGVAGQLLAATAESTEWIDPPELSDSGTGVSLIASTPFGLRRLVAGTGVTLALVGGAIEISANGGGGGEYNGPPGYSCTAFTGISTGPLSGEATGWGWGAGSGPFYVAENPTAIDDFSGIPSGALTTWTGGTGWTGAATPYTP
jgi:hypothetical protein